MQEFELFMEQFDNLIKNDRNNVLGYVSTGLVSDNQVNNDAVRLANSKLNLETDRTHNLMQVYFSDKINTTAFNELLLGDEALTLKGAIDKIKRAKAQNAAMRSIDHDFVDIKSGITHPLKSIDFYVFKDPQFTKERGG